MIKIGILGDIGSGKSFVSKQFGFPVFNADMEVQKIYRKDTVCFRKLNKRFPKIINSFPISKKSLREVILSRSANLKIINKIVHPRVRKKLHSFFLKNIKKKAVILDIPLLLENNINDKGYVLIFVAANKSEIKKKLKKRKNYNIILNKKLKNKQFSLKKKKKMSNFIIKNNFRSEDVKKRVKVIKRKILDL